MKKKILILNWRDPMSALAGGAEQITLKYAEHWAQKHDVIWLTNCVKQLPKQEKIKNVVYVRVGPKLDGTFFSYLFFYPLFLLNTIIAAKKIITEKNIDIVIDEIHGLPFFAPLYFSKRIVLLVCEVAGPIWDKMFPFPVNKLGKWFERLIYTLYSQSEIWAISQNTKKDILDIDSHFSVKVLPIGIDAPPFLSKNRPKITKTKFPSAVFLARLVKMKGIETALHATKIIAEKFPHFKLYVIGTGKVNYLEHIKNLVITLGIQHNVQFCGRVSEEEKYAYLSQAHFLLNPSFHEGFGLTIIEAGLVGTPSIVRSGSSMDALVSDGKDGYFFKTEKELAQKFLHGYSQKEYATVASQSRKKSLQYLWKSLLIDSGKVTNIPK